MSQEILTLVSRLVPKTFASPRAQSGPVQDGGDDQGEGGVQQERRRDPPQELPEELDRRQGPLQNTRDPSARRSKDVRVVELALAVGDREQREEVLLQVKKKKK